MSTVERKTLYCESQGKLNTDAVLDYVKEYAQNVGVENIVIASSTGETGAKASALFKGMHVVIVSHFCGFNEPGKHQLTEQSRKVILENGAQILTATHALSSVERAIRRELGGVQPLELIAHTLRRMGEGTKVCVEITMMAADSGLIPVDKDIIAVAGTSGGADTALLIKPANASKFFDLKIREIIAKPREF